MGLKFSSKKVKLSIALIMLDIVVMGCLFFPVVPVSTSAVMFELKGHNVDNK